MKAGRNVSQRQGQIETRGDDDFEKGELLHALRDAIGRGHALLVGATTLGSMARLSARGVEHMRRLVLEAEGAVGDAYDLARQLVPDGRDATEDAHG